MRATRRGVLLAALGASAAASAPARALMAGDPPDSPMRRLDPNVAASPWSGVASITVAGGVYSAVLISRRHVLTALHVVPPDAPVRVNLNIDGDISHRLEVARTHRHPRFKALNVDHGAHDLCVLELLQAAPESARIHPICASPLAVGQEITLVGYGASGTGSRGATVPAVAALKRVGTNLIDEILAIGPERTPTVYLFTFDAPNQNNARPSLGHVSVGNLRETGLASGDSGSPVFVRARNRWELAGINTFVMRLASDTGAAFGFGTRGGGQVLAPQMTWLRSVVGPEAELTASRP
jgi:secreted trypsin-like serine protease